MMLVQVFLRVRVGRTLMDTLKTIKKKKRNSFDLIWKVEKCFENFENVSGNYGYCSVMQFVMLLENLYDL